jgi:hypothetical protein
MAGVLFLAFILFASLALGAATAWLVVWKSKKPILWILAPLFAFLWLLFAAGPLIGLSIYLPYRAKMKAPKPVLVAPAPVQAAPATPPAEPVPPEESTAEDSSNAP